jgi:hypothetical protein
MRLIYSLLVVLVLVNAGSANAQPGSGWQWASTSGTTINTPGRTVRDTRTDAAGNVYAVGDFMGTMTLGSYTLATLGDGTVSFNFDVDGFVVKYSATGAVTWAKQFGTAQVGSNQNGSVLAVDDQGNVYVGGSSPGFVIKYDANGNQQWIHNFTYFDIGGLNIGPDGNPLVLESDQGHKNIYKLDKSNGNVLWQVNGTGAGSNAGSLYHNFVDASGNSYYTLFNFSATTVTIGGQTFSPAGTASFVVSVDNNGSVRWVDQVNNVQIQLGYTIDPENGTSYIQISGGSGGTFQGVSVGATVGNNSYLVLNAAGTLTSYAGSSPFRGLMLVKPDGIYTIHSIGGFAGGVGTEFYGNYFIANRNAAGKDLGVIVKYNKTTAQAIWMNSFEYDGSGVTALNTMETGPSGVVVGGNYGTSIKFGTNLMTAVTGPGSSFHKDFFVGVFDPAGITGQPTTMWTGNAGNGSWSDAGNWSNGIPNGSTIAQLPAGLGSYPTSITTSNITGRLQIAAGVTITLPLNFQAGAGIINDGAIQISESGTFYGGFNAGQSALTGNGRVVIKSTGVQPFFYVAMNNSLEIDCSGTVNSLSNGAPINGSLIFTQGILQNGFGNVVMGNPNATVSSTATSYLIGTLQRAVNASGTYVFPLGATGSAETATIKLNGISGPTSLTASFTKTTSLGTVNTTAGGIPVTAALNGGYWTITPDVPLAGGSYNITLAERGYTNSVTDPTRYVVIKRVNSSSAWGYFGNNGTASINSGTVTATSNGISGFSDFAIGIATSGVNVVLPLRFLSFTAERSGRNIQLQWSTEDERNTDRFDVEHSTDGLTWATIGNVNSTGTTTRNRYQFLHEHPAAGIHYYRLHQVDRDGRFSYSTIASVTLESAGLAQIYPNPATGDHLTLDLGAAPIAPCTYFISDARGTVVQKGTITTQVQVIRLDRLPAGLYMIRTSSGQVFSFVR